MILLRIRPVRPAMLGVAASLLLLGAARLAAQDTTAAAPKTHEVKKGDTLWDLAARYLGDAFRWPELYRLNTDIVEDPHWIYPGEILKLPGYVATPTVEPVREAAPPTVVPTETIARTREPSIFAREQSTVRPGTPTPVAATLTPPVTAPTEPARPPEPIAPPTGVRFGDFIRAPWIDRREGPVVWGRILGMADLPGIERARQRGRFQLNDRILIAAPTGSVAPEKELYLIYRHGPSLEGVGQVIIPSGTVEVISSPRNGDAATARIVRMFGEVNERDRLMPYDSTALAIVGTPTPVKDGLVGEVRWIPDEPVLPGLKYFVVLTLTSKDGTKVGDEVELFRARQKPKEGEQGIAEVLVGTAQVVRVTPYGATAVITRLHQPKVERGTQVRVVGKMQ